MNEEEYKALATAIRSDISPIIQKYIRSPLPLRDVLIWIIDALENPSD